MSQLPSEFCDKITQLLPESCRLADESSLQHYGRDWIKDYPAAPTLILLPNSTEQVAEILRLSSQHRVAVVPSGGRTGLSGGATAMNGEVVISLERMKSVGEPCTIDRTLSCQAGVPLERVQLEAEKHGLLFPIDFSSRGSSQIGGNIATNAGGIRVIRYGNIRDWVLGLKVVLASGEILSLNGSLFKNNTGLDLRSIFIGSEGTLGIITECTLRLTTRPKNLVRCLCGLSSTEKLLPLLQLVRSEFRDLSAFEYLDEPSFREVVSLRKLRDPFSTPHNSYVLIEVEEHELDPTPDLNKHLMSAFDNGLIDDVVVSASSEQAQELMNIRDLIGETLASHYTIHKNDISVPVPQIPKFLEELRNLLSSKYPSFRPVVFGHVGDGNLHVNILKPDGITDTDFWLACRSVDDFVAEMVGNYSGSVAAEHGVGLKKKPFLKYSRSESEIKLMREIKAAFDPLGIMNPGKVLPD